MQRRDFLKTAAAAPLAAAAATPRPNFLFMIADDLTHRGIRAAGNPEVETPNLDRLIRSGCHFTHCFHQGSWLPAVCVASRSMLNSGLTAFRVQKRIEETPLWGETFGAAGYHTAIVGKWHLSQENLKRSFKQFTRVTGGMFESGPSAYNRPAPGNTWTPWDESLKGQWQHSREWQNAAQDEIKHTARMWSENATKYLESRRGNSEPFLLYVGFNSPHDPRQAPKEYVDRYPAARIEVPANYLPEHPFDQGDHKVRDELLAPFPRSREAVQVHRSEYYAHTTYMDAQIGRILDALEASGHAGNTYVIFTADHGLAVGQHGLMGKQNCYDHSIRIPLVCTGPGIAKGRKVDSMVYQHSVFATSCELAGVTAPKSVEFPSLAGALHGKPAPKQDAVFSFYKEFQRTVRTAEHKLIVYPEAKMTQLFDLRKDPWETRNLAEDRANAATKAKLLERLRRYQQELGDELKVG
jgi:arylsulfatase A-like enzyme